MKENVKKEIEELIKKIKLNCSVEEFKLKSFWKNIPIDYKVSEDFIREIQEQFKEHNWNIISRYQKLSENFIREFQDKLNWSWISLSQKLSKDFILEFKDKVNWYNIEQYQKITKKDIEEYELKKIIEENNKTRVKNKFQLIRF